MLQLRGIRALNRRCTTTVLKTVIGALTLLMGTPSLSTPEAATLEVVVGGIEHSGGEILVGVCTPDQYAARDCKHGGEARARLGSVVVIVKGLSEGTYGILVLHDLDGDKVLKRTRFGLPAEPVGFGNDAPLRWGPPSFEQSAVAVRGHTVTTVTLRNR